MRREPARAPRDVLAFTCSTPADWGTLDHYGWTIGPRLLEMTRRGDWSGMRALVTDEILDVLVPAGIFDDVPTIVRERYRGLADGVCLRMPASPAHDEPFRAVITSLRS